MTKQTSHMFPCVKCGKKFAHKQSLNNHKQSCGNLSKFKCPKCSKVFTRQSGLKAHSVKCVLLGDPNKTCKLCHKTFIKSWHLRRHMQQMHTDSKAKVLTCNNCNKTYKRQDKFKKHITQCIGNNDCDIHSSDALNSDFDNLLKINMLNTYFFEDEPCTMDDLPTMVPMETTETGHVQTPPMIPTNEDMHTHSMIDIIGPSGDKKWTLETPSTIHSNDVHIPTEKTSASIHKTKKSRLAEELVDLCKSWNLASADTVDILVLSLKKMNIQEEVISRLHSKQNPENRGRKITELETRKTVWDFYHQNAYPSTNSSRPARLKVSERNPIQKGLDFVDTTTIIQQRNKPFYENNWMMLHMSYQELYNKFSNEKKDTKVSVGSFYALRPFYVRTQTEKDIEMCCCITHLHARWAIEAILESAKLQKIPLKFSNYDNFFQLLYSGCTKNNETTYLC